MTRTRKSKIFLSDEEFIAFYKRSTVKRMAERLGVSRGCIYNHARKLKYYKYHARDYSTTFCSMKPNPKVIPGGLPEE